MDHTPESAYAHLRDTRPAWFASPSGDGAIGIMRWPMTEGQALHRDEDGQHHRRLRIVPARPEPSVAVLPQVVHVDRFRHAAGTWQWEIVKGAGAADMGDAQNAARQLKDLLGGNASDVIGLGRVHPDPTVLGEVVMLYAARIDRVGELGHGTGIRRARRVAFAEAEQMVATGQIIDAVTIASLFRARQAGLGEEGPDV
ncbi:hypothetical protein [Streptomyces sp. NPDC001675]